MKIFVDSANPETVEALVPLRIVDGVTTKESIDLLAHLEAAVKADERLTGEVAGRQIDCRTV